MEKLALTRLLSAVVRGRLLLQTASPSQLLQNSHATTGVCPRHFHSTPRLQCEDETDHRIATLFQRALQDVPDIPDKQQRRQKNRAVFTSVIDSYVAREGLYRRRHVEFATEAMKMMKAFNVHKELACYKKLMELFPEGKMIPKTIFQVESMHYPKQQQCAIDIMDAMEDHGVIPDGEFGLILSKRFGKDAHCYRKYRRMMYWLPKFRNLNPYAVPSELPDDPVALALLALKKMEVDLDNNITLWKTRQVEESPLEDTFIANSQSPAQRELLAKLGDEKPLYVKGGFRVWLRDMPVIYFTLIAEANPENFDEKEEEEEESLFDWKLFFENEKSDELVVANSIHEQEDGTVLATCVTGTNSKDSLITWIRYLQKSNPSLEEKRVVFSLQSLEPGLEVQQERMAGT